MKVKIEDTIYNSEDTIIGVRLTTQEIAEIKKWNAGTDVMFSRPMNTSEDQFETFKRKFIQALTVVEQGLKAENQKLLAEVAQMRKLIEDKGFSLTEPKPYSQLKLVKDEKKEKSIPVQAIVVDKKDNNEVEEVDAKTADKKP